MSIKVTVAVLSSVALGVVGIGGGFLYDRLTKSDQQEQEDELSGENSVSGSVGEDSAGSNGDKKAKGRE